MCRGRGKRQTARLELIEKYLQNLYRVQPDFVYSVTRVIFCAQLPDADTGHAGRHPRAPYQTAVDIASLAPKAEVTVYPWKEPPELKARTIERVRSFLKAHQPVTAAR